jgi:hypothetical protein
MNMTKMLKKANLPEKICASCGRPFQWRKKWARNWEQVRYCSKRCQGVGTAPSSRSPQA